VACADCQRIAKRPGAGFTGGVLWNLFSGRPAVPAPAPEPITEFIPVGAREVSLRLVRHPRARRYLLRLLPDGSARVTIPRGGSAAAARDFVQRQLPWLERQLQRLQQQPAVSAEWTAGKVIWFRGVETALRSVETGWVQLGDERIRTGAAADLRPAVQRHLHRLAARELPPRVLELAGRHGVTVTRVSVRNQRTRWGSCSRHGAISLNWRLIQTPEFVRDYVILHELMHRRQLNHSAHFWREVALACPEHETAERWLKQHSRLLG